MGEIADMMLDGEMSFGIIAAVERDKIHVVKVKQVPTFIPKPTEVKR